MHHHNYKKRASISKNAASANGNGIYIESDAIVKLKGDSIVKDGIYSKDATLPRCLKITNSLSAEAEINIESKDEHMVAGAEIASGDGYAITESDTARLKGKNLTTGRTFSATLDLFDTPIWLKDPQITATAGENGTIDPEGVLVVGYGGSQEYTITADVGHEIDEVKINGEKRDDISVGKVATYEFENVIEDSKIEASFKKEIYEVEYTTDGNGKVIKDGTDVESFIEDVEYGTLVDKLPETKGNAGYEFSHWSVDGKSLADDYIIEGPVTITANFKKIIDIDTPDTPITPGTSVTPDTPATPTDPDTPDTGDNTNIMLLISLLGMALLTIAGVVANKKARSNER